MRPWVVTCELVARVFIMSVLNPLSVTAISKQGKYFVANIATRLKNVTLMRGAVTPPLPKHRQWWLPSNHLWLQCPSLLLKAGSALRNMLTAAGRTGRFISAFPLSPCTNRVLLPRHK
eukprot:Rmarinus@m.28461